MLIIYANVYRSLEAKKAQQLTSRSLSDVKSGIEHLADKLLHIKVPKSQLPSPTSDNYIIETLRMIFLKKFIEALLSK